MKNNRSLIGCHVGGPRRHRKRTTSYLHCWRESSTRLDSFQILLYLPNTALSQAIAFVFCSMACPISVSKFVGTVSLGLLTVRQFHLSHHKYALQRLTTCFESTGPLLLHISHHNPSSAAPSNSDNRRPLSERSEAPNPPICPPALLLDQYLLLFRMVPLISTPPTPIYDLAMCILYNRGPRCWFLVPPSPRLQKLGVGCDPRCFPLLSDPGLKYKQGWRPCCGWGRGRRERRNRSARDGPGAPAQPSAHLVVWYCTFDRHCWSLGWQEVIFLLFLLATMVFPHDEH